MLKKGDLVFAIDPTREQRAFDGRAIVLTQPYASTFTDRDHDGKPTYTAEKIVVDVLVENKVFSKIPLEELSKVE
jgi:hypothetical protein